MNSTVLVDIAGWLGVAALLVAYALVSTNRVQGDSLVYQLPNLLGSALLLINSCYYGAYPSVGINAAWIGIGLWAILKRRVM